MDKQKIFQYWQQQSREDFETAEYNRLGKRSLPALFFYHLAVEKLLKAHWVKDNFSNNAPFTHDLQKLASETSLDWDAIRYDYLAVINSWNIETRYPDYKKTLFKIATDTYMVQQHEKVLNIFEWLQEKL